MTQRKGIVYIVTNKDTDEKYVGITTTSLDSRKKDHLQKSKSKNCNSFQKAIATYGVGAFKWTTDNTLYEIDELAQKEQELIKNYKKQGAKLFNEDRGGGIQKTVYCYNTKDGGLLTKYASLEEASSFVNSTKQQISRACINKVQHKNYFWSYMLETPFQPKKDNRLKKVIQYSYPSGRVMNVFRSVSEASKITGINKTSIAKVCRGERRKSGECFWSYL